MNPFINGIFQQFPALSHRNYRTFFIAQLVSLVGTWMQMASIPWLVNRQTHSPYMVGLVNALGTLPVLLFTIFAGVFADRRSKKSILIFTQTFLLVNAALFTMFSWTGRLNVDWIIILSVMRGFLMAFDIPVRQSFFREMVNVRSLPSAIALNTGVFNAARIVGPAVAGMFLAIDPTFCFLINAVTFVGIIAVLFTITPAAIPTSGEKSGLASLAAGFRYAARSRGIRAVFALLATCSLFGWSYASLLPAIVEEVYRVGSHEYGFLLSACGVGAVIGAVAVARLKNNGHLPLFLLGGWGVFIVSLAALGMATGFVAGMFVLFAIGLGLTTLHVSGNALVQSLVGDEYRGRVMGLYMFLYVGFGPFGNYFIGHMAEWLGLSLPLFINAAICLAAVLLVSGRILGCREELTRLQAEHCSGEKIAAAPL